MSIRSLGIAAALVAAGAAGSAAAMDNAIEARRGYFDAIALNFGGVVAMARGAKPYSAEEAKIYTENLKALAGMNLTPFFPEGSDNAAKPGDTRALPAIWSDLAGVGKAADAFEEAVTALDAAASEDLASLRGAVGAVGETCKACHTKYRAKEF